MSKRAPAHYPISSVCMVADGQRCPPNYDLLMRSHDQKADCDLWKEHSLRKTTRYLCFTRDLSTSSTDNVLTGLIVLNEKEQPPSGFALLEKTIDSGDKAYRKKMIAIKMVPRDSVKEAIIDIALLTKSKRAPEGYTLTGDVNGILVCYKTGPVPLETQSFKHATPQASVQPTAAVARPAPAPPVSTFSNMSVRSASSGRPESRIATLKRADSVNAPNPLSDVPFQLHIKHQSKKQLSKDPVPTINYRSLNDINSEFTYSFSVERSTVRSTPKKR